MMVRQTTREDIMIQSEIGTEQDQIGNPLQARAGVMSDDVKPAPEAEPDPELDISPATHQKINIGTGY